MIGKCGRGFTPFSAGVQTKTVETPQPAFPPLFCSQIPTDARQARKRGLLPAPPPVSRDREICLIVSHSALLYESITRLSRKRFNYQPCHDFGSLKPCRRSPLWTSQLLCTERECSRPAFQAEQYATRPGYSPRPPRSCLQ